MSSNVINQAPYLRTSRTFPHDDTDRLATEIDKAYVDVAQFVNARTIGIFTANRPSITGNSFFVTSQRQQSQRQMYTFTSTAAIPHGILINQIANIVSMYGQFTDGTNWFGLIPASNVAIAGQISFFLSPTQITFMTGAGAPTFSKGFIVIEWMNQV